jgi:hypothetical protein
MNFIILFCVLLLAPLWGEEKKPAEKPLGVRVVKILKLPFEKLTRKPAKRKDAALSGKEQKNVKQYDYQTYCNQGMIFFGRSWVLVRVSPEIFGGLAPDVAMGFAQKKTLQKIRAARCEW